jgi:hypothetical protein
MFCRQFGYHLAKTCFHLPPFCISNWQKVFYEGIPSGANLTDDNFRKAVLEFRRFNLLACHMMMRPLIFSVKVRKVIESPRVASGVGRLESETLAQEIRHLSRAATA